MEEACDISFKEQGLLEQQKYLLPMAYRNAHLALEVISVVNAQIITVSSQASSNKVNRDAMKKLGETLVLNVFLL